MRHPALPTKSATHHAAARRELSLRHLATAALATSLLVAVASALAGDQCSSAVTPTADAATADSRLGDASGQRPSAPASQIAANDEASTVPAGDIALTVIGRPTDPHVQPCRHLPRDQMFECVQRVTGAQDATR